MKITYWKSQPVLAAVLLLTALLISLDIFEDYQEGTHLQHLLVEGILLVLSSGAFLLVLSQLLTERSKRKSLQRDLDHLHQETESLRHQLKKQLMGLSETVDNQFKSWSFTQSEKEIGFLLLKGLSLKEIAGIRATSEKTVQVQIQSIYGKSGIHSRSEFAAYFLEDLLPPQN